MENFIMLLMLLDDEEQERLQKEQEHDKILKSLRDRNDPFNLSEQEFILRYRFNKEACFNIISDLTPHDKQKTSLPFGARFFTTLYFYAHGSHCKWDGDLRMTKGDIFHSIRYISQLIVTHKKSIISFPITQERQLPIKAGFNFKYGMKDIIGAIGSTHIGIVPPTASNASRPVSLYINPEGYYSVNVEAVCDHDMRFLAVNAKFPGLSEESEVRTFMMEQHGAWILGNQGSPLEPWLLTPVYMPLNARDEKYNEIHRNAHKIIENAFGLLKSRFRCLSKHKILDYRHDVALPVINACFILHNIILEECSSIKFEIDESEMDFEENDPTITIKSEIYTENDLSYMD